jgi:hypothetical protein
MNMIVFEITRIIYLAKHSEPTTVYISQNDQKRTSSALFLCILYFVPFFFTAFLIYFLSFFFFFRSFFSFVLFFLFFFALLFFVDQIKGKQ